MPRRPDPARSAALAVLAVLAVGLALAGTVQGAGDSVARTAARAWHGVFSDRPQAAAEQRQRVLVVLSAPSLADRLAAAENTPTADEQRQWTADAEGAQQLLLAGTPRARGFDPPRPGLHAHVQRLLDACHRARSG